MPLEPFTPVELAAIQEVLAHQRAFSSPVPDSVATNGASELHIALDGTGTTEVSRQIVPASGGEMDAAMKAAANSQVGCRIFHNHPTQGSLSASDWNVLANHPGMQMTAVNSRGTTFRGEVVAVGAFPSWFAAVARAEGDVSGRWESEISSLYDAGQFDLADFAQANGWLVTLCIAERLRDLGLVEFLAVCVGADAAALADPRAAPVLRALRGWCAAAIP